MSVLQKQVFYRFPFLRPGTYSKKIFAKDLCQRSLPKIFYLRGSLYLAKICQISMSSLGKFAKDLWQRSLANFRVGDIGALTSNPAENFNFQPIAQMKAGITASILRGHLQ